MAATCRQPVRGPSVLRGGAPARMATRCSQFRHSASRGSKRSMPSSLRTLSSTRVPGMACIWPRVPPLDDMARASPPWRGSNAPESQIFGTPRDEGCKGFDARYTGGTRRRCRRIDCREGVGQNQNCQKDTSPFEGVGRATSEPLSSATIISSPFSKCRSQ
jgi:hypothetical protein